MSWRRARDVGEKTFFFKGRATGEGKVVRDRNARVTTGESACVCALVPVSVSVYVWCVSLSVCV